MSDAPGLPEPADEPSTDELENIALPARARRAPRFSRIVGTGMGGAAVVGALCGMLLPNATGVGRGMVSLLVALAFALIGGFVAGLIAIALDRTTPRYMKKASRPLWSQDEDRP